MHGKPNGQKTVLMRIVPMSCMHNLKPLLFGETGHNLKSVFLLKRITNCKKNTMSEMGCDELQQEL